MTPLKVRCKQCGRTHTIEVDVHAGNYAEARDLAALMWNAEADSNTKALAAVLVLRALLARYHAPADWLTAIAGLYSELADNAERTAAVSN